jgi:hypothetical protein
VSNKESWGGDLYTFLPSMDCSTSPTCSPPFAAESQAGPPGTRLSTTSAAAATLVQIKFVCLMVGSGGSGD